MRRGYDTIIRGGPPSSVNCAERSSAEVTGARQTNSRHTYAAARPDVSPIAATHGSVWANLAWLSPGSIGN